jgi:uncharacterized protein (DUF1501 family)
MMHRLNFGSNRRSFLLGSAALAAGSALPRMVFAAPGGSARLVVVILRGALDGLSTVPPIGDPDYARLRRELAIAPPGDANGALALNSVFGLHPALTFLHERYRAGELIVFNAVASPYRDRSHFDAQNVLENGLATPTGGADGWLNRALDALAKNLRQRAAPAIAVSQNLPLILRGAVPVLSKSPMTTPDVDEELLVRLADLYSKDEWLSARLSAAVQSEKLADDGAAMSAPMPASETPASRKRNEQFSRVTRMAAAVMRTEGGPTVAALEAFGWDTHANQGGAEGALAQRLAGLDQGIRGLSEDLGTIWSQTAVLIVTEFGRTAAINGTRGTDHGTGGCAFLLGGAVQGGRVIADWPGLAQSALYQNRDLRPTLDLRSLFKTVLSEHLHVDSASMANRVFPDSAAARPLRGLMRA